MRSGKSYRRVSSGDTRMTDVYSKSKRSEIMSRVKSRGTGPEGTVAALLRKLGMSYRRNSESMPGHPDFVMKHVKAVIFVHGCFWHNHPGCRRAKLPKTNAGFWKRKIRGNRLRDIRTTRLLRSRGWRVITVWQCHLRRPEAVLKRLTRLLG